MNHQSKKEMISDVWINHNISYADFSFLVGILYYQYIAFSGNMAVHQASVCADFRGCRLTLLCLIPMGLKLFKWALAVLI